MYRRGSFLTQPMRVKRENREGIQRLEKTAGRIGEVTRRRIEEGEW